MVRSDGARTYLCALGLTSAPGIVTCAAPATLRLAEDVGGGIRVTTDAGLTLDEAWLLGGPIKSAAVQTPDGEWQDVSEGCPANSVPHALVQAWADRTQRTLVNFRLAR